MFATSPVLVDRHDAAHADAIRHLNVPPSGQQWQRLPRRARSHSPNRNGADDADGKTLRMAPIPGADL